ncbi:MAG TPA: hypothetical protein DCM27_04855 [Rhodospirillaceae bacterium]|nr:hypothetical protein [Rhodospirillaceae bacterium]
MISSINSSSSLMTALMAKLSQSQQSSSNSAAAKAVFSKIDANGDGKVTSDELAALGTGDSSASGKAAAIMSASDKDGDKALNEEELASFLNQLTSNGIAGGHHAQLAAARGGVMVAIDENGDGALSYAEFSAMKPDDISDEDSPNLFNAVDANGDGILSFESDSAEGAGDMQGGMKGAMMGPSPLPPSSSDDDDEDDTTVSSLLSKLIDSLTSSTTTDGSDSTDDVAQTDADNAQQKLFNFFDQDQDGKVSDTELNDGINALKTAMASYMLSVQESRAAA